MKLLFLDIDGVLNDHQPHPNGYCGINPQCVYRLNHLVTQTNCHIILSSAWRYLIPTAMSLKGFHYLLMSYGLDPNAQLLDATIPDEIIPNRGEQILHSLKHYPYTHYAILDDGSDLPPHPPATKTLTQSLQELHPNNWIKTQSHIGLTDHDVQNTITILQNPLAIPSTSY